MDGFIFVDKEKEITSFQVCNKIKWKLKLNKTGHNGTLDPNATGLMIVAVNKATKLMKYINEHNKEYVAKIKFGKTSETLDYDSNVLDGKLNKFSKEELINSINELKKEEYQIPPMTSAIKINGKKLYEYQREGIEIEVEKRKIKINDIELLDFDTINYECTIRLNVSKGFYVRSFARDLGQMLNSDAIIKELRRTKIEQFDVSNTKKLDEIEEKDIIKIEDFFNFPKVKVNDYIAKLVKNGVELDERQTTISGIFFVVNNCDIIAIYEETNKNIYKPVLIF
ncbi:MAG: tRNA pseudouridine(55) synthase TruB [Acholeplasmatales bacterium]|nr:tRNA pseudouridine(55) synthase TruB [Acholeplasmatales bacterium]